MFGLHLTQKNKMALFIGVLCVGFIVVGIFTSQRLTHLVEQYSHSAKVSFGAKTLYATQSHLLSLAAHKNDLTINDVSNTVTLLGELKEEENQDIMFLNSMELGAEADVLRNAIAEFDGAMRPWLELKSELGFSADEGKLGVLKKLAAVIEERIAETGMVSINADFQVLIKAEQNYLLEPSDDNLTLFNRAMAMFKNSSISYSMMNLYESELNEFQETFVRVGELSQQLEVLDEQLNNAETRAETVIYDLSVELTGMSSEFQASAESDANSTIWTLLISLVVLAAITISIAGTISFSMNRSLSQVKSVLDSLSEGDLSTRLTVGNNKNDEFNQLAVTINQSCEHLGELVQGVQRNSEALTGDTTDLNHEIDSLVQAQHEVIDQTDLLTAATEEVSCTTIEVSNSLEVVAQMSIESTKTSQEGAEVIGLAIESLEEVGGILASAANHIQLLEEASMKVDSVMDIINGIAEQTNLLALNAAIEAARAGEQGRGFAVVADEVRNLAVRTVDAVSDISSTIETMKNESSEVIRYINQSEETMKRGQDRGMQAMASLSQITDKASNTADQTTLISDSIKELATTSQSMAESMAIISQSLKQLEVNNDKLRETSGVVDDRSTELSNDCARFTV
ncbi:methyl-accepting chemotaxis protein [Vibrio sp. WJH972]